MTEQHIEWIHCTALHAQKATSRSRCAYLTSSLACGILFRGHGAAVPFRGVLLGSDWSAALVLSKAGITLSYLW